MKIFAIFIIIIFFSLGVSFAQTGKKIYVPILKENAKIDSLLEITLKSATFKNVKEDRLILYMVKINENNYFFSIGATDKAGINYSVEQITRDKSNCGYFKYKKFGIFVWANENKHKSLFDFFSKSNKDKSFINPKKLSVMASGLNFRNQSYDYKDGIFSIDMPPVVH